MSDTLTESEQKEIRSYIYCIAHDLYIDVDSLPKWLHDLELMRREREECIAKKAKKKSKKKKEKKVYAILMRRYGDPQGHTYLLGTVESEQHAMIEGELERYRRGAKYEYVVYECAVLKNTSAEEHTLQENKFIPRLVVTSHRVET